MVGVLLDRLLTVRVDDEALEVVIEGMSGALSETAGWIADGRPGKG